MSTIACLTFNANSALQWQWDAYDEHGGKLLSQDKCQDLPHAVECALAVLLTRPELTTAPRTETPKAQAKKPPARRKRRRPA